MKISPARTAAFDVLFRIETEKAFSSALLPVFEDKLAANDRGLCHEIALGVLRRKLYLDRLIDELSKGRKLDVEVRIALQIGLFQMIFLDRIPPHSAINESVELVSRAKKTSAKSFVNALLRSYQRRPHEPTFVDEVDKISISTSHPRSLVERWISQFGLDESRAICEVNNRPPALSLRLIGSEIERRETLAELASLKEMRQSEFVDGCFLAEKMSHDLASLSDRNRVYFQDEGSQFVANAVVAERGFRILDVCAAPGGKTTMIASSGDKSVVAGDIHFTRVQYLRETCAKHEAASVSVVQYDAETMIPFEPASFDTVFVDAPCSGTGTIRHNPEIRYSIGPADILQLSSKQLRILKNASELVKPGGRLIYSTCSLESEENEAVCDRFLQERGDFDLIAPKVPSRFLASTGFARTFPHRDELDGFFIAVFRRNNA